MVEMRKRTLLIVLSILLLGSLGTILSSFYLSIYANFVVYKTSYGFPIGWHGHESAGGVALEPFYDADWFSLESLLLDIAFWFAISSLAVVATIKAVSMLHKRRMERTKNIDKNRLKHGLPRVFVFSAFAIFFIIKSEKLFGLN
jgi:hypothetical protein